MTVDQTINAIAMVLLAIFDTGMIARISKILLDGQMDEEQNTKKMVKTHFKAMIVINVLGSLILIIRSYYV